MLDVTELNIPSFQIAERFVKTLTDTSLFPVYNMGLSGSQPAGTLGLPLQQPMVGQSSFNSILNTNQNLNFGQQRQPPPSQ
jgi:hypothetical protein